MNFHDLIGAPYKLGGRGPAYDCASLAIEMQARQGRVLRMPEYPGGEAQQHVSMVRILRAGWRRLEAPERGCLVFFPAESHVGTMLDRHRFFHTTSEVGDAHTDSLKSPLWKSKRREFYLPV